MLKGLGEIGLGGEEAARALEGLGETQVRGESNLVEYSKTAGMLASIGGEKGKEGEISRGLAGVTQARGGDVNDLVPAQGDRGRPRSSQGTSRGKHGSQVLAEWQRIFEAWRRTSARRSPRAGSRTCRCRRRGRTPGARSSSRRC
jgi:hypothetical protein